MAAYSGTHTITLSQPGTLPNRGRGGACGIALTSVEFDYDGTGSGIPAITTINVKGESGNARSIDIDLTCWRWANPLHAMVATATDGTGGFANVFDLAGQQIAVGAEIHVRATVNDGGACQASTERSVALEVPSALDVVQPDLPRGCLSGFERSRNALAAGHPDKFLERFLFRELGVSYRILLDHDRKRITKLALRCGYARAEAARWLQLLEEHLADEMDGLFGAETPGTPVDIAEVDRALAAAERAASNEFVKWMTAPKSAKRRDKDNTRERSRLERIRQSNEVLTRLTGVLRRSTAPALATNGFAGAMRVAQSRGAFWDGTNVLAATGVKSVVRDKWGYGIAGLTEGVRWHLQRGWLGVLYFDRLRIRSSGTVAGERLSTVSLAPGEELTLTQRSETKKSTSLEAVETREQERGLEFDSTWSTDLSQAVTNTTSHSTTVGGGVNVGATISGVTIGGGVSGSSTSGDTHSVARQQSESRAITNRASSKARAEHKTTVKLTSDVTEEIGSRRLIRNPNPTRALDLNIYKLYDKLRVLLERYDARLSVKLRLSDPGRDARKLFLEALDKIDPQSPSLINEATGGTEVTEERWFQNDGHAGGTEYARQTFTISVPSDQVVGSCRLEIRQWLVSESVSITVRVSTPTDSIAVSTPPVQYDSERPSDQFRAAGGDWRYDDENPPEGKSGRVTVNICLTMPEESGPGWWTPAVLARLVWQLVPSQEAIQAKQDERTRRQNALSQELVMSIVNTVKAGEMEPLRNRVLTEFLLPEFAQAMSPPGAALENFYSLFEWERMCVEYLPEWLTRSGRERQAALAARVATLPASLNARPILQEFLTASEAQVMLPIRLSKESVALLHVLNRGALPEAIEGAIGDFTAYRDATFGANLANPGPNLDLEINSPDAPLSTPAGAPAWDNDWERLKRRYRVLDEWFEFMPSDGIHIEPALSTCDATDEARARALESDLADSAAARQLALAKASALRATAGREKVEVSLNTGYEPR